MLYQLSYARTQGCCRVLRHPTRNPQLYPIVPIRSREQSYTYRMHPTMRHILTGSGSIVALAVLATFLILYGRMPIPGEPAVPQTVQPTPVPFTTVATGTRAEVTDRVNYLITNQSELDQLWALLSVKAPEPKIDFNTQALAAVFAGAQPSTGYQVQVTKVVDADKRSVVVTILKPGTGCVTAKTITSPFEIIAFSQTSLPLAHEDSWTVKTCK